MLGVTPVEHLMTTTETTQSPVFTTDSGNKLSRISNDRQLRRFLSDTWQQKRLRIDGSPGLTIHQSGRWHLDLMSNGQRVSTTLGRYPEVTLAEARNRALSARQDFLVNGKKTKLNKPTRKRKFLSEPHLGPPPLTILCLSSCTTGMKSCYDPRPTKNQPKRFRFLKPATTSIWRTRLGLYIPLNSRTKSSSRA